MDVSENVCGRAIYSGCLFVVGSLNLDHMPFQPFRFTFEMYFCFLTRATQSASQHTTYNSKIKDDSNKSAFRKEIPKTNQPCNKKKKEKNK
jgi:hypothetical protein